MALCAPEYLFIFLILEFDSLYLFFCEITEVLWSFCSH